MPVSASIFLEIFANISSLPNYCFSPQYLLPLFLFDTHGSSPCSLLSLFPLQIALLCHVILLLSPAVHSSAQFSQVVLKCCTALEKFSHLNTHALPFCINTLVIRTLLLLLFLPLPTFLIAVFSSACILTPSYALPVCPLSDFSHLFATALTKFYYCL
jgi:hypothetical protein